jgi:phosphoribosyl-ATP pyrophosphohydrolase/phosphoribosyl-AMP cyclohydrolase
MKKKTDLTQPLGGAAGIASLRFVNGLIPAVIQDHKNKEILMVAYMNRVSLQKTMETGETHFFSRSRKKLWRKGETSGHLQKVKSIRTDCDRDTLLIRVDQVGVACHTGVRSCFFNEMPICQSLYETIANKKKASASQSYTRTLFDGGIDRILKKIGEEAGELIISAKNKNKMAIIHESADLIYHLLVMLCYHRITPAQVEAELVRRSGQSGLAEKKSRATRPTKG